MVVVVLKDELINITPLELESSENQNAHVSLVHASYPADRRHALTGHFGCRLLARDRDLWLTDCDTHAASSGGPVFVQTKEKLKLAAVMVGVTTTSMSIAVPAANWIQAAANKAALSACE
jgi:V8-like Glu-specific endopeptidase